MMNNQIEKYYEISNLSVEETNSRVITILIKSSTIEELNKNIEKEIGGTNEFN